MAVYVLSWPGLPEIPSYVIDPKSNRLYSLEQPVPPERLDLNIFENRYVKLSKILELFAPNVVPEVHFILENLQKNFSMKPIVRITEKHRKITSYLPVEILLVLIIVFPLCISFQSMKRSLLKYLDHFPESICRDCGYVHRDCKCSHLKTNPKNTFVGFATTSTEKGIQTDPLMFPTPGTSSTPAISTGMQMNNQDISMLIPSGVKLPAGMKIPVTPAGGQVAPLFYPSASGSLGLNMWDTNTNPFGFLNPPMGVNLSQQMPPLMMPQPRSHKRGRPPVSPFPYLYQTNVGYQPNVPLFGLFGGDGTPGNISALPSLMQMPQFQGPFPPDFSIPGCLPTTLGCNVNFMRPMVPSGFNSTLPVSSSTPISSSSAGNGFCPIISRKRKYSDGELESGDRNTSMKTIAVQTSAKSFTKKCKLKEEKLADKNDGHSRGSATVTIVNEVQENLESNLLDSENKSESSQLISKLPGPANLSISPGKLFPYADFMRREDRDVSSKKFGGNLWRQLDDSSDDDDKPTAGSRDGNGDGVVQNTGVNVEGKDVSTTDMSKTSSVDKDVVFLGNNVAENKQTTTSKGEECCMHGEEETGDGAWQKTERMGDGLNLGSSIDKCLGSDNLSLQTIEKTDKVQVSVNSVNDLNADKNGEPTATEGSINLEVHPTSTLSVENESSVLRNLPDEISDQKKDPTGEISLLNQENVSHAQDMTEIKADGKAVNVVSSGVGRSDQDGNGAMDGTSAQPVIRKIYGKFEYVPTQEHIFRCLVPKCSQSFDTRLAAEMHNLVHAEDGENTNHLKCPKCEFTAPFYHWFDLVRHLRQSHQTLMSREPFSCKLCGLVFENEEELTSHIDFHYSNRYKCIHCGLLLLTWGQVKRHLESCADKHKGNLNLGCPYCTFVFHKKNIRNLHLLSHSDVGLSCALCQDNAAWADWKSLRKHYQNKHTKMLQGKIAPYRHKLPTKRKPPRCKRCNVEFKNTELYVAHMTRTHDLVPYTLVECAICGHRFRTERSHEWHVKHVHVESISCEKCDFVATSKSVMKAHVAQKHSDKQHTCSECEKSFAFYHQLKVHMAHHARHTIYPCQKCDREFTRQNDLRQHLVNDHEDPSDKAPQSCPECEYRCFSRANLNAHIRRLHPDLLEDDSIVVGAAAEEEEEGADHCYFTKKADAQPTIDLMKVRRFGRKKVHPRKTIKYEWDRTKTTDSYSSIKDRHERRRMNRLMKETDDRMKKLKKLTCARTRSYNEHQAMKNGGKVLNSVGGQNQLQDQHLQQSQAEGVFGREDSGRELGEMEVFGLDAYGVLPYLDHNYCKFESSGRWMAGERCRTVVPNRGQGEPGADIPDVSAFQECETQLLGLTSVAPARRRGRPPNSTMNRNVNDARRKFTAFLESMSSGVMQSSDYQTIRLMPRVAPATETRAADDDGLENLSAEIPDFELIAESDLLKNLGSYNIIDELFGMTQASGTSVSTPEHAAKKAHLIDLPTNSSASFSFQSPRESSEAAESLTNTFSDGLVMDSEAQLSADFDDIELGEDVYSLFLGGNGGTQSGTNAQLENGSDELNKISIKNSASPNDVLSLTHLAASASYMPNSISPRSLASPRRIGNSFTSRNVPGLQNLNRNSSVNPQPLTSRAVSASSELPFQFTAYQPTVQPSSNSNFAPSDGTSYDRSELKNCSGDGLFLTKKTLDVKNSVPSCDDGKQSSILDNKASEALERTSRTPEVLHTSNNLFAVSPEAAYVAPTPATCEVQLHSAGSLGIAPE